MCKKIQLLVYPMRVSCAKNSYITFLLYFLIWPNALGLFSNLYNTDLYGQSAFVCVLVGWRAFNTHGLSQFWIPVPLSNKVHSFSSSFFRVRDTEIKDLLTLFFRLALLQPLNKIIEGVTRFPFVIHIAWASNGNESKN